MGVTNFGSPIADGQVVSPAWGNLVETSINALEDGSNIPDLAASKITSGHLALARGGTGSDLSATGGAHQFLQQGTAGAAVTSAQPAFTDISGTASTAQIPGLPASQITSGQIPVAQGGTNADLSATGGTHQFLKQATAGAAVTSVQPTLADIAAGVAPAGAFDFTGATPSFGVATFTSTSTSLSSTLVQLSNNSGLFGITVPSGGLFQFKIANVSNITIGLGGITSFTGGSTAGTVAAGQRCLIVDTNNNLCINNKAGNALCISVAAVQIVCFGGAGAFAPSTTLATSTTYTLKTAANTTNGVYVLYDDNGGFCQFQIKGGVLGFLSTNLSDTYYVLTSPGAGQIQVLLTSGAIQVITGSSLPASVTMVESPRRI